MTTIALTEENGILYFYSPYNVKTPSCARSIGGKWDGSKKAWKFDPASKPAVLEMARKIYKWTPEDALEPPVSIRISAEYLEGEDALELGGRVIAQRPSRDERVRLGEGVVIVSGEFHSRGGSSKYPCVSWSDPPVLQINGLTRTQIADLDPDTYTIVDVMQDVDAYREELLKEKKRLSKRIADIDDELIAIAVLKSFAKDGGDKLEGTPAEAA